jgi:hypothetical protein
MSFRSSPVRFFGIATLVIAAVSTVGCSRREPPPSRSSQPVDLANANPDPSDPIGDDDLQPTKKRIDEPLPKKAVASNGKTGLVVNGPKAFQGYTLFFPLTTPRTFLIDMDGKIVHSWRHETGTALRAQLLENGHLLRAALLDPDEVPFTFAGVGGLLQELTWDGELVWEYKFVRKHQVQHHDIQKLPNGNVMFVVWDRRTEAEALAAGRSSDRIFDGCVIADSIFEVKPTGKTSGEIVWEWNVWDHLIQDHDKSKANYGDVGAHPELIDVNFYGHAASKALSRKDNLQKLRDIGYMPQIRPGAKNPKISPDWLHCNSVDFNEELNQIIISCHEFGEIWIVDHSTTKAEAAGHKGGNHGKGGDLLYRWGNPRAYRQGTREDQRLFGQHNAHWIPKGYPGADNILVLNNGLGRGKGLYSSVDEIVLPVRSNGTYTTGDGVAFGPKEPVWSYTAPTKSDFYAEVISGAQRLPNGNTLVCSGPQGIVFEVTPDYETVWKYINPGRALFADAFPLEIEVLPPFSQDLAMLTTPQKSRLHEMKRQVNFKLNKLLSSEQKNYIRRLPGTIWGPRFAEILAMRGQLQLSSEQHQRLKELQRQIQRTLENTLSDDARALVAVTPPVPDGSGAAPSNQRPVHKDGTAPDRVLPEAGISLFRSYRFGRDFAAFAGKALKPDAPGSEPAP